MISTPFIPTLIAERVRTFTGHMIASLYPFNNSFAIWTLTIIVSFYDFFRLILFTYFAFMGSVQTLQTVNTLTIRALTLNLILFF